MGFNHLIKDLRYPLLLERSHSYVPEGKGRTLSTCHL